MKYLKDFDTESNYLAYRYDKENYLKPNISLCEGNDMVYYNYPPSNPNFNGYDYVDLGLPSGTLWATCNVGASEPTDFGLYFQWGDTSGYTTDQIGTGDGKKEFSWADYKWYESGSTADNSIKFKKYTTPGAILELEDDAAHVNMGGDWHMPTPAQIQELIANTTRTTAWINKIQKLIRGITFRSKHDSSKSIFIPAAGYAWGGSVRYSRKSGHVWSSMLSESNVSSGQYLSVTSSSPLSDSSRYYGRSVRGVLG